MNYSRLACLGSFVILSLGGCNRQPAANTEVANATGNAATAEAPANATPESANHCGSIPTDQWAAWVNTMPGPGAKPKLIVVGQAHPTSMGYKYRLDLGAMDKMNPPTLHLNLVVSAEIVSPTVPAKPDEIKGEFAPIMAGSTVVIDCEGKQIGSAKVTIAS